MHAVRPTPTPTMLNVSRSALPGGSTTAAYTPSAPSRHPGDHPSRDDSIAAYRTSPGLEAHSWQPPQPQPQNSAYGISYTSHGANVNAPQRCVAKRSRRRSERREAHPLDTASSSPFANDQSEPLPVTDCASNLDPRVSTIFRPIGYLAEVK